MANVKSIITNSQGNVLINTETDNGYRLNVSGNTYTSGDVDAGGYGRFNGEGLGTTLRVGGIYSNLGLYVPASYDMQFALGWDGSFKFTRGNVDKFRIDSSGFLYNNSGYLAYGDGTFTNLYAPDVNGGITMGDATAPINVYYNDTHTFQSAGQLVNYGGFTSTGFGVGTVAPSSKLEVVKQGNASGGTMLLSGSKTNNATKYGIIATTQYASDTETEGVGLIGGVNTSTDNAVVIGGGIDELNTATVIRFFTAANTTTRGSANEQMRINSSGSVGMGISSPQARLDVLSTLNVQATGNADLPYINFSNNGRTFDWGRIGGLLQGDGDGALYLSTKNGGSVTEKVRITSLGNVGINNTSPAAYGSYTTVHIGSASSIGLIKLGTGGTADGPEIFAGANNNLTFNTSAVDSRMRIFGNTGNVTINTNTDSGYKLDVNGSARIQGNSYVTSRNYISLAGDLPIAYKIPYSQLAGGTVVSDNLANGGSAKAIYSSSTPGTFFFGPYSSIEPGSYVAKFRLKVASNASSSSIGAIDVAGTNISGNSLLLRPSMFPTSGEYYYFSVPFTVGPAASGSLETRWLNWPGGVTDAYVDHVFIESAQSEAEVYVPSNKDFNVYADGTSRMVVKNSGNVGIGTTSPSEVLTVNGAGTFRTNANNFQSTSQFTIDYYDAGSTGRLAAYKSTGSNITFFTNPASGNCAEVMRITSAGNVLIGTTTDSGDRLFVNGSVKVDSGNGLSVVGFNSNTGLRLNYGNASGEISVINMIANGITNGYIGIQMVDSSNGDLWLGSSGNRAMTIYRDRNVGIGTTNPTEILHVKSPGNNGGVWYTVFLGQNSTGYQNAFQARVRDEVTDLGAYIVGTNTGSNLSFSVQSNGGALAEAGRFAKTGNFLIGTTTDSGYKLRVYGQGYFDSVVTMVAGFSSYTTDGLFNANAIYGSVFTPSGNSRIRFGYFDQGGGQYWGRIGFNGLTNYNIGTAAGGESFQIGIGNDSSAALLINNAGQVGIGTTNPTAQLQVNGNFRLYTTNNDSNELRGIFNVGGTADPLSFSMYKADATTVGTFLTADGASYFNGGNVLIGTTTDAGYKLDVIGTGRFINQTIKGYTIGDGGKLNVYGGGDENNHTAARNEAIRIGRSDIDGSYYHSIWSASGSGAEENHWLRFYISNANGVDQTLAMIMNGNGTVGIGTTSGITSSTYTGKLSVFTATGANFVLGGGTNTNNAIVSRMVGVNSNNSNSGNESAAGFYGVTSIESAITTTDSNAGQDSGGYIMLKTKPEAGALAERMRITSGGNALIGTQTDGGNKLDVVAATAGDGGAFNGTGSVVRIKQNTGWSGAQPWALFVEGYSYLNGFRINAADGIRALYKTASGGQLGFATAGDDPITFAQNAGDYRLYIATGGNLIVGSSTDAGYKLDVHGEILGRDDIRILNTYALILNGTDANWRIGRNTITDSGWLTSNTLQVVVFGGSTGQGFQVVNTNGTALFEIDGVAGASRFTNALGVGVDPSGTAGRIDASNDIVAYSTSDQRLKENITPIANALDKVKALTGVEFDWKEETKAVHGYEGHDVGVIAQEVQAVLPEAVRTNDSGYLSVRYEKMIGLLIEAMKEQQNQIDELKAKLDGLTK